MTILTANKKTISTIRKEILPKFHEEHKMGLLNIWSAAASSGQEALSITMDIKDKLDDAIFSRTLIDATDISQEALEKAKKGIYSGLDVQRGLPITTLMKHIDQQEDESWKTAAAAPSRHNSRGSFPTITIAAEA